MRRDLIVLALGICVGVALAWAARELLALRRRRRWQRMLDPQP